MKIKSITDVITNSSSEVFCYKLDDPEYIKLKKLIPDLPWKELKDYQDIKNLISGDRFYGFPVNPQRLNGELPEIKDFFWDYEYKEILEALKESGRTEEEMWEFFKFGYKPLLGRVYYELPEGSLSPEWKDKIQEIRREEKKKRFPTLVPGQAYTFPLIYPISAVMNSPVSVICVSESRVKLNGNEIDIDTFINMIDI